MKIEWTFETRETPKLGLISKGDIREIEDDYAEELIKSGLAKEYKIKKVKTEGK